MLGNTFGRMFRITTCGESYGGAFREGDVQENLKGGLVTIVDGVPAGITITSEMIEAEMEKRRPGLSDLSTPRKERDKPYILSGVMEENLTTGAPIGIYIPNTDILPDQIKKHKEKQSVLRPGQATYTYMQKYGENYDYLGAGRSSGRETASRVAGGAVAKAILEALNIDVIAFISSIHDIKARDLNYEEAKKNYRINEINCPDKEAGEKIIKRVLEVKESGDTLGGTIDIIARGVPEGVGEPVFDKLQAVLGHALLSIGAIKGIEFGKGFEHSKMLGSQSNDIPQIDSQTGEMKFKSNNAGGILGGISNGEDIRIRVAVKPTPTLAVPEETVDLNKHENITAIFSTRNDPTICTRIYAVCEAMTRIALLDAIYMSLGFKTVQEKVQNKTKGK